ncbi:MAG: hydroxyacylglutathione hydrolase [Alphaproteobacteria bacterium]|nr:hydroxyacylglutathione hydrolase [Alphaproteobacteria bacterium]
MTTIITPVLCNEKNMANYAYIINKENSKKAIIIDAAEEKPILNYLKKQNLTPTHIITTHHHFDHVEGNLGLKEKYNLKIIAPIDEFDKVPGADIKASDNTLLTINEIEVLPILAKGHTNGHMIYYIKELEALFTGDVLFNLCVGGLFEGTPHQMFESLNKIKSLPNNTKIFPGHEYTRSCIEQSMLKLPNFDTYLQKMYQREQQKLCPTTIDEEKQFNPYLKETITI